MSSNGRLLVLAPPDLENGFLLAGVEVRTVTGVADAEQAVDHIVTDGLVGVVAVYEPFLSGMSAERRDRLERSLVPVVLPLPTGSGQESAAAHRARLLGRLQRAIGFHVTFGEEDHD